MGGGVQGGVIGRKWHGKGGQRGGEGGGYKRSIEQVLLFINVDESMDCRLEE